jgi:hypothetical protein
MLLYLYMVTFFITTSRIRLVNGSHVAQARAAGFSVFSAQTFETLVRACRHSRIVSIYQGDPLAYTEYRSTSSYWVRLDPKLGPVLQATQMDGLCS